MRAAATFYIEQILLFSDADSYRVLGASAETSSKDLRRNMALLMRWLHPDSRATDDRAIFAHRVSTAWESLKSAERRADYDAARKATAGMVLPVTKRNRLQVTTASEGRFKMMRAAGVRSSIKRARQEGSGELRNGRFRMVVRFLLDKLQH